MSVKVIGLNETLERLRKLPENLQLEIKTEIRNSANEWVGLAKRDVQANSGDTGNLASQISTFQLDELSWEVVSGASYAGFVEFGTRSRVEIPAGLEDVASEVKSQKGEGSLSAKEAIYKWLARKQIAPELWWPIFISLMTKGMHAHPYFFKQRAIVEPKLLQRVDAIIKSLVND